MSDIDEFVDHTENDTAPIQKLEQNKLKPLYRQFTSKLMALLFVVILIVGLIATLFYQENAQNNALVKNQLTPLTQQLNNIQALQKADKLVSNLLIAANAEKFVELHAELIALDRHLLQQNNTNAQLIQQWLNNNKLAEDIVSRIQGSHTRNQQLKQSSIIQLQLMLFSITPIVEEAITRQSSLQQKLEAEQDNNNVSFSSANDYAVATQQLNDLQKLQALFVDVLASFEQLTMYTSIDDFELLRLNVEQIFALNKRNRAGDTLKAMADVDQQIDTFEKIVLTDQRALAKWQGYIRLAQDHQLDLKVQQQQINQLLLTPYEPKQANGTSIIHNVLAKLGVKLSNSQITLVLMISIALSLLCFFYLLWRLREQIKMSTLESVEIIRSCLQPQEGDVALANCVETQTIIKSVQNITKPEHNEQEFQALSEQCQSKQQLLAQQKEEIEQLAQRNEQQQSDSKAQIADLLKNELQRYQFLEETTLPLMQVQQAEMLNHSTVDEYKPVSTSKQIVNLYQQLKQFHLAIAMKSEKSVLKLSDINLVDEIHAIIFNKQQEQLPYDNQLFVSCDEQLLTQVKIDFRLFQQLMNRFLDISLQNCRASQIHLHVKLQDKSAGQQLVHFIVKVKSESVDALPSLITELVDSQSTTFTTSPLIEVFNVLFAKQHGENVVAQLVDDGYQFGFELPLANATSANSVDKILLENTKVMLLSNNTTLAGLLENIVLSVKGTFEKLARIDSFEQQFDAEHLTRHKLDLLVVASDMALQHLDLITQQVNSLPQSLQPKLMVLQTPELSYERFGFYSQAEQVLCRASFLLNVQELLASEERDNQLLPCEQFLINQYSESELPLLLAVHSPEHWQNLQRLLQWLGLQVQVVSHEAAQLALWRTGQYSLLVTEFADTALVEMSSKPVLDIAVFSLTDVLPQPENKGYFANWHLGKLTKNSTLAELIEALAPWLKKVPNIEEITSNNASNNAAEALEKESLDEFEQFIITEVPSVLSENDNEVVFDFAKYLTHQGTAELALIMLDDYTQNNHQQLDTLVEAIKAKNIDEVRSSVSALTLNAKILCAPELISLCDQWSTLLSGNDTLNSVRKINTLLKDTRIALNEIDEYAETI